MRLIDADALKEIIGECPENWTDSPEEVAEFNMWHRIMNDIDSCQTIGGWISVKDRLPENQNPVMVFVPPHVDEIKGTFLGYVGMAYYTSLGEGFWCGTDGNLYGAIGMIHTPTHWMPLPEPPKENKDD